jgi:hypothetical protein
MAFCLDICLIKAVFFPLISISFGCMSQILVCGVVHIVHFDSCVWVMFKYKCKSFRLVIGLAFGNISNHQVSNLKFDDDIHAINFNILDFFFSIF